MSDVSETGSGAVLFGLSVGDVVEFGTLFPGLPNDEPLVWFVTGREDHSEEGVPAATLTFDAFWMDTFVAASVCTVTETGDLIL